MEKLLSQANTNALQTACAATSGGLRGPGPVARTMSVLASICLVLFGMAALAACSDDHRPENSELRADPSTAPETIAPPAAAAVAEVTTAPLPGVGNRYQVVVETAYFFDKPEQAPPNGRYLRRGDSFYGEGETNGFVKTGFVQPNGAAGIGWLKVQGLSKRGANAGARPPRQSPPSPTPRQPVAAAPPAQGRMETGETAAPIGSPSRAMVQADRAYFYNSPDLASPRKAYCERGDKVRVGEQQGTAVYVTFTNWEKVTTTGWMKKAALRFTP